MVKNIDTSFKDDNNSETFIDANDPIVKQYKDILNDIALVHEQLANIKNNIKKFYKVYSKQLIKFNKLKKPHSKPRKPTGFRTLADVPPTLVKLLQLKPGEKSTRPRITKQIYHYIEKNNLHDKEDNRIIHVNNYLRDALQLTDDEMNYINSTKDYRDAKGLNFYNIQKHIARVYSNYKNSSDIVKVDNDDILLSEEEKVIPLKNIKAKKSPRI